ncbi:CPXCG motif-containing cysteine-rich protein [bacterium]|nr:CPXCG motif-containing cysteine-rich protein [bacterium]
MRDDDDLAAVETVDVDCPNCGRPFEMLVDTSVGTQDYVEDCEVCCRPIHVHVTIDADGDPIVTTRREDD